jgi:phosphomannomutase/phosphoglucomutase
MAKLFGTVGIRGVVNETLTPEMALRLGKAIGRYMNGTVAMAADTRVTGDMVKNAVAAGLMSVGCNVLDLGMTSTPVLQFFVKRHDSVDGAVMITASHNPPQYNGVECIYSDGTELSRAGEEKIEAFYEENVPFDPAVKVGGIEDVKGAMEAYINAIADLVDVPAIKRANLKVTLDCANGASSVVTPVLLKRLGVTAVTLNANPQGDFPGRPSEPTQANLHDLISLTRSTRADLGIAHDADGNRTVFITGRGRFVSGDEAVAVVAKAMLAKHQGPVVTPVSSSKLLEDAVKASGGSIVYTPISASAMARKMKEVGAILGGDESGGMIIPQMQYCRDGAMAVAKMIECVVTGGPLEKLVDSLPKYSMEKRVVDCPEDKKQEVTDRLREANLSEKIDETDGLKITFTDGWVLLRPSGSEQKYRVFSEAGNEDVAKRRADDLVADIGRIIGVQKSS